MSTATTAPAATKPRGQGMTRSGFCSSGHHGRCPHVMRFDMGVWVQRICSCDCHPATTETNVERTGK
jgi:hypothetical protein